MGIIGIIFDSDGVIFDSEYVHYLAFREAFLRHGFELSEEHFDSLKGMSSKEIISGCFDDADDDFIDSLTRERSDLFIQKYSSSAPLVRGVGEFIGYLKKNGYRIIVVTNGLRENTIAMMRHHNIDMEVLSVQDFILPKPDPAGYIMALQRLSLQPDEAVVFEDSPLGIRAAKAAGIMTVGVMSKNKEEELPAAGADIAIKDFAELDYLKDVIGLK